MLLWRPADSNTNGYIWYRGGDLGGGDYPQTSTIAEVTVDILRTVTSTGNSLCSNVSHYKLPLHLRGSVVNKLTIRKLYLVISYTVESFLFVVSMFLGSHNFPGSWGRNFFGSVIRIISITINK